MPPKLSITNARCCTITKRQCRAFTINKHHVVLTIEASRNRGGTHLYIRQSYDGTTPRKHTYTTKLRRGEEASASVSNEADDPKRSPNGSSYHRTRHRRRGYSTRGSRCLQTAGDFRPTARVVASIPGIDRLHVCLQRAMRQKSIVNIAAHDPECSR